MLSESPMVTSSQPTGWRGWRLAITAPTTAAITAAPVKDTAPAPMEANSGRPAWRSNWSNQTVATTLRKLRPQSGQASTRGGRRGWDDALTTASRDQDRSQCCWATS
jgi:hypothetical protein